MCRYRDSGWGRCDRLPRWGRSHRVVRRSLPFSHDSSHRAGLCQAGDRVLIHAAAGGLGLAAVQLARQAGAEIYATAGSPEKRAFVQSLGVKHVFDSRTLDFADEIMQVTGGKGVNVILNSLTDEFIPKRLSVLADH